MNEIRFQNIPIERSELTADMFVTEMLDGVGAKLEFIKAPIQHEAHR